MHVHSTLCPNGDLLLTSMYLPGIHAYPMHLLRMYLEHENHLRELTKDGKTFDFEARPIPAGIDTFVSIWSEDTHCLYGFSALDPSSGVIRVRHCCCLSQWALQHGQPSATPASV